MSITDDYQFDLDGHTFGQGCPVKIASFEPGTADFRTQDSDNALGDRKRFGRDYLDGPAWTFEAYVDSQTAEDALDQLAAFSAKWRNEAGRRVPGNVRALRYQLAGRMRRVYGRPRRLTPGLALLPQGRIDITCDFQAADALTYDDVPQSLVLATTAASYGGFPVPATAPWGSLAAATRADELDIAGTARTSAMTITFLASAGSSMANPKVVIDGQEFGLNVTLAPNTSVTIDILNQTVTGALSGQLTRNTRLEGTGFDPGKAVAIFTATDPSGLGRATISWRAAHTGL